jgi:ABC-2 type transport system ATP-binding protein
MTLGIILPDAGTIQVFGRPRDVADKGTFGYLPEERGLYPKMKVLELLVFFGRLRGLSSREAKTRALAGLKRVELDGWGEKKVEELSKGMQQKIQLLVALLHTPRIAILDEPFSGLDPVNVELFYDIIQDTIKQGTSVILSTHQMEQVEQLCNRIALINKGEVVLQGEVDEVRRRYGTNEVHVEFAGPAPVDGIAADLVTGSKVEGREARYTMKPGVKSRDVVLALLQQGCDVTKFGEAQASMHDIFVDVVTGRRPNHQVAESREAGHGH